jgi:hypothetical protein
VKVDGTNTIWQTKRLPSHEPVVLTFKFGPHRFGKVEADFAIPTLIWSLPSSSAVTTIDGDRHKSAAIGELSLSVRATIATAHWPRSASRQSRRRLSPRACARFLGTHMSWEKFDCLGRFVKPPKSHGSNQPHRSRLPSCYRRRFQMCIE